MRVPVFEDVKDETEEEKTGEEEDEEDKVGDTALAESWCYSLKLMMRKMSPFLFPWTGIL